MVGEQVEVREKNSSALRARGRTRYWARKGDSSSKGMCMRAEG